MVTVKIMTERSLDTPEDIAAYLSEHHQAQVERSPFAAGEVVAIVSRAGMMPEFGMGDVAVVLLVEPAPSPYSTVRVLHANGSVMTLQVQTANLATRA